VVDDLHQRKKQRKAGKLRLIWMSKKLVFKLGTKKINQKKKKKKGKLGSLE